MRFAFADLTQRLRAQNPSLLIDPCLKKVRTLQANASRDAAREREELGKARASAFWEAEQRLAGHVREWDRIYGARTRSDLARIEAVYPATGGLVAQAEPPVPSKDLDLSPPPPPPPTDALPALPEPAFAPEPPPHPDQEPEASDRTRRPWNVLTAGGKIMGYGLGTAALGGIFYGLAALTSGASVGSSIFIYPAVVLGVTVGPLLLAIGLVVVIIGGIWYLAVAP
jgi:hypothetical protein